MLHLVFIDIEFFLLERLSLLNALDGHHLIALVKRQCVVEVFASSANEWLLLHKFIYLDLIVRDYDVVLDHLLTLDCLLLVKLLHLLNCSDLHLDSCFPGIILLFDGFNVFLKLRNPL